MLSSRGSSDPGIKPTSSVSPAFQVDSLPAEPSGKPLETLCACQVASIVSYSLQPYGPWPTRFLCPWDSLGQNTGMGCHALLQGYQYLNCSGGDSLGKVGRRRQESGLNLQTQSRARSPSPRACKLCAFY